MKRNPHDRKTFIGIEVENTKAKGLKTLFLAGAYSTQEAIVAAMGHDAEQIYLAANQSYLCRDDHDWAAAIIGLLNSWKGRFVTIDVPFEFRDQFLNELSGFCFDQKRLIVQYSLHVRDVSQDLPNTYLKLDDRIEDVTNPGVWVWPWAEMLDVTKPNFTSWQAYKEDQDV